MSSSDQDYLSYGNVANPLMTAKLDVVRSGLIGKVSLAISDIAEAGDHDFRLSVDLSRDEAGHRSTVRHGAKLKTS